MRPSLRPGEAPGIITLLVNANSNRTKLRSGSTGKTCGNHVARNQWHIDEQKIGRGMLEVQDNSQIVERGSETPKVEPPRGRITRIVTARPLHIPRKRSIRTRTIF